MTNALSYGDNLDVLRHEIASETVDLIYLDPPFNSQANYNVLCKSPAGKAADAQIEAFEDTWHWGEEAERAFAAVLASPATQAAELLRAMRSFLGENDAPHREERRGEGEVGAAGAVFPPTSPQPSPPLGAERERKAGERADGERVTSPLRPLGGRGRGPSRSDGRVSGRQRRSARSRHCFRSLSDYYGRRWSRSPPLSPQSSAIIGQVMRQRSNRA